MLDFQPTFLYIKRHSTTGKCYFGKTTSKDPVKYTGSGLYWERHINEHGKGSIETLWYCLFTERAELIKFATLFSEQQDIVKNDSWLNLKPENGLDGGSIKGRKVSVEERRKRSESMMGIGLGRKQSTEECRKKSERMKGTKIRVGLKHSTESRIKMSVKRIGKKDSLETRDKKSKGHIGMKFKVVFCPYCDKSGGNNLMKRYHFSNCKQIKELNK